MQEAVQRPKACKRVARVAQALVKDLSQPQEWVGEVLTGPVEEGPNPSDALGWKGVDLPQQRLSTPHRPTPDASLGP